MFLLICIVLLLVSAVLLVFPWLRQTNSREVAASALNTRLREEQIQDLDERLALGLIEQEAHTQMRLEIDKRLLEDIDDNAEVSVAKQTSPRWVLALMLVIVAAISIGLYFQLGQQTEQQLSERFKAVFNSKTEDTAAALAVYQDIAAFADPATAENIEWLYMAAQGYMQVGHYRKAAQLYDRMVTVAPNEAQLLANAAQAHYLANERKMVAVSEAYLERAFAIEPHQQNALGFAGMAAFENQDFGSAVKYWQRAVDSLPPAQRDGNVLVGALAEAKRRADLQGLDIDTPNEAVGGARTINIRVTLGDKVDVSSTKTVFVLARAKNGPPMPLAAKRIRVADLPAQLTLSKADAMTPAFSLASFDEVVVTARISQTGNAITQSGDIGANEVDVLLGPDAVSVELLLDRPIP